MYFESTIISESYIITREPIFDNRGSFQRLYCQNEFENIEPDKNFVQINLSNNYKKGTLRGLHYQKDFLEDKIVACLNGKIFDVCLDIRRDSNTFGKYVGLELSAENGKMLYVPKGCAHGFLTMEDNSQVLYMMSEFYVPGHDAGIRFDDPFFGIKWPEVGELILSDRDMSLPYYEELL